jgi:hypothetical protein
MPSDRRATWFPESRAARRSLCPRPSRLGRDASLGSAICWQVRDLREVTPARGLRLQRGSGSSATEVERPTPAVPCRRRSDPGEFRRRREARRVARRVGTWWNLFVRSSPSHAETNNSACTIAACGGALENRVAVAAFAQRGGRVLICLAGRGLSTHVALAASSRRSLRSRWPRLTLFPGRSQRAGRSHSADRAHIAARTGRFRRSRQSGFALVTSHPLRSRQAGDRRDLVIPRDRRDPAVRRRPFHPLVLEDAGPCGPAWPCAPATPCGPGDPAWPAGPGGGSEQAARRPFRQ